MSDARFEDGAEQPLRLLAQDADDLAVLSALLQDAVFAIIEMTYARKRRRLPHCAATLRHVARS